MSYGLTVRQPWADLIMSGKRLIEVRSWMPAKIVLPFRLYIHAGLKIERAECRRLDISPSATGVILGCVDVVAFESPSIARWKALRSLHLEVGDRCYGDETWMWMLSHPRRFVNPIPYKGRLGLFEIDDNILEKGGILV